MAAGQMAEFFATFGFKINKADIQKIDRTLDHIEKRIERVVNGRLNNMKVQVTGFRFSDGFNARLYKALQKKMTLVNNKKGLSPEITLSKFDVDRNALLREMKQAVEYVESNLRINLRTGVQRPAVGGTGVGGRGATGGVSRFGAGMGAGAAAGSLGRGFIPGLGLAFGVTQLNRLNQQLIGQELAATAVFEGQEPGREQLNWVRDLGNKIGFDYRSQANPYMKMAAAGKTAGMSTGQVQEIFTGMAEYGRVMGLNDEDMKGSMRAVEQMLNKGQVYAEELKMQLGEKFPAAIQLMAEAVSGGDTEKLFDMMEKGEVSSIEALPKFAKILSRQARVGGALTEAMKTSLAEQMRFNNTFNDLVMFLSEAGFEEGQAGIFRTMADFFMEMKPLLTAFGEAWKYVADVLRIPLGILVDLGRGIEGLADHLNVSKGKVLAFGGIIAGLAFPFTRTVTAIGILLGALEDFTGFLSGRQSLIGHLLGDQSEEVRQNFLSFFETVLSTVELIVERIGDLFELLGRTDFPLVNIINDLLQALEATFEAINAILGGKTKEERMAQKEREASYREKNPLSRLDALDQRAYGGQSKEEQGYGSSLAEAGANFIEKHPLMLVPRELGFGDFLRNMSQNRENIEDVNQDRFSTMFGQGSFLNDQYNMANGSNITVNINNPSADTDVEKLKKASYDGAQEAVMEREKQSARNLSDKARGAE